MAQAASEVEQEGLSSHSRDSWTQKDLTTCSICFETFKRPKHLPCLHSFCETCLQSYIDATKLKLKEDSGEIPGIACPLCRLFVEKQEGCDWNEWASSLPMNHLLAAVIDVDLAKKSKMCNACARENESKSAIVWCVECAEGFCETCERQHRRFKYVTNHKVVDISSMDQLQQLVISHSQEIMCPDHPKKALEAYCEDHSTVCCLTCAMLNHRKCEKVGTIENAVQEKRKNGEDTELKESFIGLKRSLTSAKEEVDGNLQILKGKVSDIESDIHQAYDDFIKHGQRLRDEKLQELRSLEKSHIPVVESKRDEIAGRICALENDLKLLGTTVDIAPDAQFLLNLNRLLEQKVAIKTFLEKQVPQQTEVSEIKFEKSSAFVNLFGLIDGFGELVVTARKLSYDDDGVVVYPGSVSVDLLQVKPKLKYSVPVGDETVKGVGIIDDKVVIAAEDSKAVKLFDSKGEQLSSYILESCPVDLKMFGKSECAVKEKKKITFFKVLGKSLKRVSEIELQDESCAFAYHESNLHIADERKILIKDMKMKTSVKIEVEYPIYYFTVRADGNVIYTNTDNNDIHCIKQDGSKVWEYVHDNLKYTAGLTVDHTGNVLVCDRDSNNVYLLTSDGKFHSILLSDFVLEPECIDINEYEGKLAVGCAEEVLVYDLS